MKTTIKPRKSADRFSDGFALVVSLTMLVLLTVIAVGLLSLSAITLRTTSQTSAQAEAQANARMALMIAIGELQKQMGPDQRISANGSILSESTVAHPHWMGAWDSWIAGPLPDSLNSNYPSAESHHQTIGNQPNDSMRPDYDNKDRHFRTWLLSLSQEEATNPAAPLSLALDSVTMPDENADAIRLVGTGSLGELAPETEFVSARLMDVSTASTDSNATGRYAWWVGDESQKAKIMSDSYEGQAQTSAEQIFRAQSPASTGTTTIAGLANMTPEQQKRLKALPSRKTLDLVPGVQDVNQGGGTFRASERNFHHTAPFSRGVLADVREGGLKRDLSILLERPIDRDEDGDPFMLYAFDDPRFSDRSHSRVPIQDLAAYYQMYDDEPDFNNQRREGVRYGSSQLGNNLQLSVPNFDGGTKDRQRTLREYTALYRQPAVTKIQFLVAVAAQEITEEDRQFVSDRIETATGRLANNLKPMRDNDTYKLRMGIIPKVTLWNPNNLPLVMDSSQIMRFSTPPIGIRFRKYRSQDASPQRYDYNWTNLSYLSGNNHGGAHHGQAQSGSLLSLRFGAGSSGNIIFEPGEVKVFTLSTDTGSNLLEEGEAIRLRSTGNNFDVINDYDPFGFFLLPNSTPQGNFSSESPEAFGFLREGNFLEECLVFNPSDRITFSIEPEFPDNTFWQDGRYVSQTRISDPKGSGFSLYFMDEGWQTNSSDNLHHMRHYTMLSRYGTGSDEVRTEIAAFNRALMAQGFPGGEVTIDFVEEANSIPGGDIIGASADGEVTTLFEFSLSLGCEVASGTAGFGGGRRIASRPFLHSPSTAAPFIDQADPASLYNHGWDWMIGKVNTVENSILQSEPQTGRGYYGGGYTVGSGTTHVIQRQIPVLPTISIAALSHAHLGGFSLAHHLSIGDNPENDNYTDRDTRLQEPGVNEYQRTTATGQAGLGPHVMQAIGNSYAHPNIPADQAFTTKTREFDASRGSIDNIPFVDHSYLANKALWDQFFFSSISPQPSKIPLFGASDRTALEVASDFFFNGEALPNRRMKAYSANIDQSELTTLFDQADAYTNGLADKIAAHLMVEGTFNINSTSVEAWKVFLSSLKGKPVAYYDGGITPAAAETDGIPLATGILPNAAPIKSSEINGHNLPPEQWQTGRELTDDEIQQLAEAIVKQVKLRGPFLSISEFVNRRLSPYREDQPYALKGALQAALDDPTVDINANFRQPNRLLDSETVDIVGFDFPAAATGPIAYGSMAYVDQADVLQHFSEQITVRGDTFIIRAYGDSTDASGNVIARAWCEATVQRVPDYCDPANEPHQKTSELVATNMKFGRKFTIVNFRWLNADEV